MNSLSNLTLEVSLKPFTSREPAAIRRVCQQIFRDWAPLAHSARQVSVLLWASDGSEILSYRGRMDEPFEWARYIGSASRAQQPQEGVDPKGIGLHTAHYLYRADPPAFTYGDLKEIIAALKQAGQACLCLPIRVGIAFDPGPEFAESPFKYKLHPEILAGSAFGGKSLVCCYHKLHADAQPYAGFPEGIPEETPVATFLGRQAQCFLSDMALDYLWLSNGFGFGSEPWRPTGITFDGERFYPERRTYGQQNVVAFWRLFRQECSYRVETRGTNLTVGLDMATDGVNLARIYDGGYDLLPPPNSPWAALDGNFGLELAGYLSRIARLPEGEDYLFRYYIHDPWWINSPWVDRYEGQPHDIYLPLSLSRLDEAGCAHTPGNLSLLSIDNSLGQMPQRCVLEPTVHLLAALAHAPDAPAPLVWIYPFDRYCEDADLAKCYFEDRFIVGAINAGLPLSSVIDDKAWLACRSRLSCVAVAPVPPAGSEMEAALLQHCREGGQVLLYGALHSAGPALLNALHIALDEPLSGELTLEGDILAYDRLDQQAYPSRLWVDAVKSDGGLHAVPTAGCHSLAMANGPGGHRVFAVSAFDGRLLWLRGRNDGLHIHRERPCDEWYPAEVLMRALVAQMGWGIRYKKAITASRGPVVSISRHDNGFFYSGYCPDTTVGLGLSSPMGAPLLMGYETLPEGNESQYRLPRAFHLECRVFVRQKERSLVSCHELIPVDIHTARRIEITGLSDAEVTLYPTQQGPAHLLYQSIYPYMTGQPLDYRPVDTPMGPALYATGVTGRLVLSDERLSPAAAETLRRPPFTVFDRELE